MKEENARQNKCLPDVKLCVVGASNVGKSAISVRFLTRRFIGEYERYVEQTYRGMIHLGKDTIKYDLKDSSRMADKTSLTTWSTCIAVIYSITDQESFSTASSILDDIDGVFHETMQCKRLAPSIALIGNKKDLEHLRKVGEKDGRSLAEKHGADFWEVSASEDYKSTSVPLNSLIVESFINGKNTTRNSLTSSPSSSGNETKSLSSMNADEVAILIRRKSDPCYEKLRSGNDMNNFETGGYISKESDDVNNNNIVTGNSSPVMDTIKRRRKNVREPKRGADKCTKKISPPTSTPTTPNGDNYSHSNSNITIEVTDAMSPVRRSNRSQSWSKTDKKRVIQRKSTEKKYSSSLNTSIPKSRSFTDLKTLEKDSIDTCPRPIVSCKSAILLTENDVRANPGNALNNKENRSGLGNLLKSSKSVSTSSFSKFAAMEGTVNYWNKLRKERRKLLTLSLEQVYDNNNGPGKIIESGEKSPGNTTINGLRNIGKKSVRRKISSIFRPRSIIGP